MHLIPHREERADHHDDDQNLHLKILLQEATDEAHNGVANVSDELHRRPRLVDLIKSATGVFLADFCRRLWLRLRWWHESTHVFAEVPRRAGCHGHRQGAIRCLHHLVHLQVLHVLLPPGAVLHVSHHGHTIRVLHTPLHRGRLPLIEAAPRCRAAPQCGVRSSRPLSVNRDGSSCSRRLLEAPIAFKKLLVLELVLHLQQARG